MHAHSANRIPGDSMAEQRVLDHIKGALRVMVDWRAPAVSLDRKKTSVRFALRSFCRHLERLMVFEERGGYLESLSDTRPNWEVRVEGLREDHEHLRELMQEIAPHLDEGDWWSHEQFDSTCGVIRELLDEVDRHDRSEIALLQEALLIDEGGEG